MGKNSVSIRTFCVWTLLLASPAASLGRISSAAPRRVLLGEESVRFSTEAEIGDSGDGGEAKTDVDSSEADLMEQYKQMESALQEKDEKIESLMHHDSEEDEEMERIKEDLKDHKELENHFKAAGEYVKKLKEDFEDPLLKELEASHSIKVDKHILKAAGHLNELKTKIIDGGEQLRLAMNRASEAHVNEASSVELEEMRKLEKIISTASSEVSEIQSELAEAEDHDTEHHTLDQKLQAKLKEAQGTVNVLEDRLTNFTQTNSEIAVEIGDGQVDKLQKELQIARTHASTIEEELQTALKGRSDEEAEHKKHEEAEKELQESLSRQHEQYEAMRVQHERLEKEEAEMRERALEYERALNMTPASAASYAELLGRSVYAADIESSQMVQPGETFIDDHVDRTMQQMNEHLGPFVADVFNHTSTALTHIMPEMQDEVEDVLELAHITPTAKVVKIISFFLLLLIPCIALPLLVIFLRNSFYYLLSLDGIITAGHQYGTFMSALASLAWIWSGVDPLVAFFALDTNSFIVFNFFAAFIYVLYWCALVVKAILAREKGDVRMALVQLLVVSAVGSEYYVHGFHRSMEHRAPNFSLKMYLSFAFSFFVLILLKTRYAALKQVESKSN